MNTHIKIRKISTNISPLPHNVPSLCSIFLENLMSEKGGGLLWDPSDRDLC